MDGDLGRATGDAEVARLLDKMDAFGVEIGGDTRGQALVEKQAHRWGVERMSGALRQGRPEGRPRRGWALAYSSAASNASAGISG